MQLIFTRAYYCDDDLAVDRLYQRGNVFALHMGAISNDSESWTVYNAEQARRWLSEQFEPDFVATAEPEPHDVQLTIRGDGTASVKLDIELPLDVAADIMRIVSEARQG